MWARVSRYQFPAAEIDQVIAALNDRMASFEGRPGLGRAEVFVSRRSGAGITVTVWESEDAMRASEAEADRLREDVTVELIGWIEAVEEYEIVYSSDEREIG